MGYSDIYCPSLHKPFKLAHISLFIRKQMIGKEKRFYHFVKVNFITDLFYTEGQDITQISKIQLVVSTSMLRSDWLSYY